MVTPALHWGWRMTVDCDAVKRRETECESVQQQIEVCNFGAKKAQRTPIGCWQLNAYRGVRPWLCLGDLCWTSWFTTGFLWTPMSPYIINSWISLSCSNQLYVSNATDFVVVEAHIRARSLVGSGWCVNLACIPTDISNCLLTSSRIFMAELWSKIELDL